MLDFKIIAVDFDGTLCENKWPEIGYVHVELIDYLKAEQKKGSKLILWTCRCGLFLEKAVVWCEAVNLKFDAINENLPEVVELYGLGGPKIYAELYIDDKACRQFDLPFKPDLPFIPADDIDGDLITTRNIGVLPEDYKTKGDM